MRSIMALLVERSECNVGCLGHLHPARLGDATCGSACAWERHSGRGESRQCGAVVYDRTSTVLTSSSIVIVYFKVSAPAEIRCMFGVVKRSLMAFMALRQ